MLILALAEQYSDVTYFVKETQKTFLRSTQLFIKRSGVETFDKLDLDAVIRFKTETLRLAKPVTFNGYLRYLRVLGDYAFTNGYLDKNHFRTLKTATAGKKIFRVLENEPINKTIGILEGETHKIHNPWFWVSVIKVLYYSGMRRRQLTSLEVGDIDLKNNQIILHYRGSKTHREWKIPIHPDVRPILERLLSELRAILDRLNKPSDPLFHILLAGNTYKPDPERPGALPPVAITDFFKWFRKRKGVYLGAQRFRHTFATNLCNPEEGEPDVLTVQRMLGHTSLQTTKEYVVTKPARMAKVIAQISLG